MAYVNKKPLYESSRRKDLNNKSQSDRKKLEIQERKEKRLKEIKKKELKPKFRKSDLMVGDIIQIDKLSTLKNKRIGKCKILKINDFSVMIGDVEDTNISERHIKEYNSRFIASIKDIDKIIKKAPRTKQNNKESKQAKKGYGKMQFNSTIK